MLGFKLIDVSKRGYRSVQHNINTWGGYFISFEPQACTKGIFRKGQTSLQTRMRMNTMRTFSVHIYNNTIVTQFPFCEMLRQTCVRWWLHASKLIILSRLPVWYHDRARHDTLQHVMTRWLHTTFKPNQNIQWSVEICAQPMGDVVTL